MRKLITTLTSEVKSLRSEVNEMRQSRREDLKTMKTLLEKVHQTVCASSKAGTHARVKTEGGDGAAGSASGRGRRGGKQLGGSPGFGGRGGGTLQPFGGKASPDKA